MSEVTDFFLNKGTDQKGRTLADMIFCSDHEMEASHDFVQWMFPLHEKSYHARYSPVVTKEDADIFSNSLMAQQSMKISYLRFRLFLGIPTNNAEDKDEKKIVCWCNDGNHNLLRITRIIRSLRLFGMEETAQQFYKDMKELAESRKLSPVALKFWTKAAEDDKWNSMTDDFLKMKEIKL